jgi:predicted TIM-barrel fold metal-dependent hydrolase
LGASYRETRILCPLLERHANLYLSLSPPFAVQEGIERICARAGARHLVFGTGYPHAAPGAAITYLMYARITEEERRLIGAGNLERLLSEVAT